MGEEQLNPNSLDNLGTEPTPPSEEMSPSRFAAANSIEDALGGSEPSSNGLGSALGSGTSAEIPNAPGIPLGAGIGESGSGGNIFMDDTQPAEESEDDVKDNFVGNYVRAFLVGSVLICIDILLALGFFSYWKYLDYDSMPKPHATYGEYVTSYKGIVNQIRGLIGMDNVGKYQGKNLLADNGKDELSSILRATDIDYIQKKDLLKGKIQDLLNSTSSQLTKTDEIKREISQFGFLPAELKSILETEEGIASIQRSLMSLEIIKFSSAMKVFSNMDTFLNGISDILGVRAKDVENEIANILSRGEQDVENYVSSCYLNPYETSFDCTTIGDFDTYYEDILKEEPINRNFFKVLMEYINIKLEESDIPNFSIIFNGFDASDQSITFTVDVNTSTQDEVALMKRGITNPHIFIFTNLINLLKQSTFIIGEEINTKSLKVEKRDIILGGDAKYTVNNSTQTYTLPIQKTTEREIFDYIDIDASSSDADKEIYVDGNIDAENSIFQQEEQNGSLENEGNETEEFTSNEDISVEGDQGQVTELDTPLPQGTGETRQSGGNEVEEFAE